MPPKNFVYSGELYNCNGCGTHCNMCTYKKTAQQMIDSQTTKAMNKKTFEDTQIFERKEKNDNTRDLFAKKFGVLKKASVLLFYGRANDAFDEIAKAAQIIKNQSETKKENELAIQKRWQFKLGIQDGFELPKPLEKIRPEDITDEFLKKIDAGGATDISTIKLYIQNVCPLVRAQYDRDTFLDGLIEDLYMKCEDIILDKKNTIDIIQKNVEKLGEVAELMEALGSDAEKETDLIDNEGNPIKIKKKRTQICEYV